MSNFTSKSVWSAYHFKILPKFEFTGLHQPVCQLNKNFNQTAGQVAHEGYPSCVVRATDIAIEAYNKSIKSVRKSVASPAKPPKSCPQDRLLKL